MRRDDTVRHGTEQGMEVINDPDVEAVWICSPSQFHADQIKAAAKAGKHVFCEKPIATDLAGTIEAVQVHNTIQYNTTWYLTNSLRWGRWACR